MSKRFLPEFNVLSRAREWRGCVLGVDARKLDMRRIVEM